MFKRLISLIFILLALTSCSPSAQRVSNQKFDAALRELSKVEKLNQRVEYKNINGTFYTITMRGVREIAFTGYRYNGSLLGSKTNPLRIYLYPEIFFKTGGSFQRIILCKDRVNCTDITLSYVDASRQFTPIPIPNKFYGLSPLDISTLATRNAPAIERMKFILMAREKGLQKLYSSEKGRVRISTPKDRVNVIRKNSKTTCYTWSDNQDSMTLGSYRFNSCFQGYDFIKGDLADFDLTIIKKIPSSDFDPFIKPVKLLTDEYKLSPYGKLYLSVYQGIESKYISSLNYQPVLPKRDI